MSGFEDRRSGARHGAGADRDKSRNEPNDQSPKHPRGRGHQGGARGSSGEGRNFQRQGGRKGDRKPERAKDDNRQRQKSEPPVKSGSQPASKSGPAEPKLPTDIDATELDEDVRRELRPLPKHVADNVAAHLVATGYLLDTDPQRALEHARYARKRAARIPSIREANGVAAYNAAQWNEALTELRTARRLSGGPGHIAMMADAERAMGRPERALELSRSPEAADLDRGSAIELFIVAAGARRDLGEIDASVVSLQLPELDPERQDPWSARLFYAYADNLLATNRVQEAFTWFVHAAHADDEGDTDAAERLDELVEQFGGQDVADELVNDAAGYAASESSETEIEAETAQQVENATDEDERNP